MSWTISNHRLNNGTSNIFIVGVSQYFNRSNDTYSENAMWTGATNNRNAAANAVYGYANYFASANNVLSAMKDHNNTLYFAANMDLYDDTTYPRGSHTYFTNGDATNGLGHWKRIPKADTTYNQATLDYMYWANFSYCATNEGSETNDYWYASNCPGTRIYHSNWVNAICTTGTTFDGTNIYSKMFSWFLMDEPYKVGHRAYQSNDLHVACHFECCTANDSLNHPTMVDVINGHTPGGSGGTGDLENNWSQLSNYITILAGNDYGVTTTQLWRTQNIARWCFSKISNSSQKMAIPFLPGNVPSQTAAFYVFYGSIVAGANGVIWWMDSCSIDEQTNYTYQKSVFSEFTSARSFNPNFDDKECDSSMILNGTDVGLVWANRQADANLFHANYTGYPVMSTCVVEARAIKGVGDWRLFVINNDYTYSSTFSCSINDTNIKASSYSNAWDNNQNLHTMITNPGIPALYTLIDTIPPLGHRVYYIGPQN